MRVTFVSNHVEPGFPDGRLTVQVTIEDFERQLTRRDKIFFSVPADFHAHNDLVAAALMAVMGRGFREARFNFPISSRCAEIMPRYHKLEYVGPVDRDLEPRRPGRYPGVSFSGGLDSVGVWTLFNDIVKTDFRVITAEYEGFYREAVGYASYHRDVSCHTNFRRVFGDRGRRFDAAVPLLFADYADLHSFVSGHTFGSMPSLWVDPRSGLPFEFLPQNAVAEAGGLHELHVVRCLHTPGFLRFLVATAPERIETGFFVTDHPGTPKYVMKAVMLRMIFEQARLLPPAYLENIVLPARADRGRGCGLWCVWMARNADRDLALRVTRAIGTIDWSPIESLNLDFYWRYCPITAQLIPEQYRETLLAGLRATGVEPMRDIDYEELESVRQFVVAVNPPGSYSFEE